MNRIICKSKIHRATITEANINYEGSITIDRSLMDMAQICPFEQVHVLDVNNGNRFITYVIEGERNSGIICVNGAAARLVTIHDLVIIITYAMYSDEEIKTHIPRFIMVDNLNNPKNEI